MKKIIVRLQGGMGNQLFQYFYALYISRLTNRSVFLDTYRLDHPYRGDTKHGFALVPYLKYGSKLNNNGAIRPVKNKYLLKALYLTKVEYKNIRYFHEIHNSDLEIISSCCDTVVIEGYWQNLTYVSAIKDLVVDCFSNFCANSTNFQVVRNLISEKNSVALHVRRGDYVSNANSAKLHKVIDINYYIEATNKLKSICHDPSFFIFTDDVEWVKENLSNIIPRSVIVSGFADLTHHDELGLMTICKHHIISNSSYSWWAAFLNTSTFHVVIAPSEWHINSRLPDNFIPSNWVLL